MSTERSIFPRRCSFTGVCLSFSYFLSQNLLWLAKSIQTLETEKQNPIEVQVCETYLLLTDAIKSLNHNFSEGIFLEHSETQEILYEEAPNI